MVSLVKQGGFFLITNVDLQEKRLVLRYWRDQSLYESRRTNNDLQISLHQAYLASLKNEHRISGRIILRQSVSISMYVQTLKK